MLGIRASTICLLGVLLAVASCTENTTVMALVPGYLNAKMDGVTDETSVLQTALDDLPDGGTLILPSGTMILSAPITLADKSATIRGQGAFATRLRWVKRGGLSFSDNRTGQPQLAAWEIAGIQFEAGLPDAGTALLLAPQSLRLTPSVLVHDCNFQPVADGDYWSDSIDIQGGHLGQVSRCYFRGNSDPNATTAHHVHLSGNSTSFVVEDCHGQKSQYGVLVEDETEGALISKCFFVDNSYGYVLNIASGGQPLFNVEQSWAASSVYPLWMVNGRSSSITGNGFTLQSDSSIGYRPAGSLPSIIRIEGEAANDVVVTANTLEMNDKSMASTPFVAVDVESGKGIVISGNTLSDHFPAGSETGVKIGATVNGALIADNLISLHDPASGVDIAVAPQAKNVVVRSIDAGN